MTFLRKNLFALLTGLLLASGPAQFVQAAAGAGSGAADVVLGSGRAVPRSSLMTYYFDQQAQNKILKMLSIFIYDGAILPAKKMIVPVFDAALNPETQMALIICGIVNASAHLYLNDIKKRIFIRKINKERPKLIESLYDLRLSASEVQASLQACDLINQYKEMGDCMDKTFLSKLAEIEKGLNKRDLIGARPVVIETIRTDLLPKIKSRVLYELNTYNPLFNQYATIFIYFGVLRLLIYMYSQA